MTFLMSLHFFAVNSFLVVNSFHCQRN